MQLKQMFVTAVCVLFSRCQNQNIWSHLIGCSGRNSTICSCRNFFLVTMKWESAVILGYTSSVSFCLAEMFLKIHGAEDATAKEKQVPKSTMGKLAHISSNLIWYLSCVISYTESWHVALVSALGFLVMKIGRVAEKPSLFSILQATWKTTGVPLRHYESHSTINRL